MKKLLLAAMLAALAPAAQAQEMHAVFVCGAHIVQINTNADSTLKSINADNRRFDFIPASGREIDKGQAVLNMAAFLPEENHGVLVRMWESGRTTAREFKDGKINLWKAECRETR